jgi:polygalacturonase
MQAIRFYNCNNLTLSNLTHVDSPRNHISINHCKDASISNLHIIAPKDSPNTDGIDIGSSTNVLINNTTMETGNYNKHSFNFRVSDDQYEYLLLLYLILIVLNFIL